MSVDEIITVLGHEQKPNIFPRLPVILNMSEKADKLYFSLLFST